MDKDFSQQLDLLSKIVKSARTVLQNRVNINAAQDLCLKSNLNQMADLIALLDEKPAPIKELQSQFNRKGKILG